MNAPLAAEFGMCAMTGWMVCLQCYFSIAAGDKLPVAGAGRAHLHIGPHKAKSNGSGEVGDSSLALGKALVHHGAKFSSGLLVSLSASERQLLI